MSMCYICKNRVNVNHLNWHIGGVPVHKKCVIENIIKKLEKQEINSK